MFIRDESVLILKYPNILGMGDEVRQAPHYIQEWSGDIIL
jgi:hypothetical protein